MQLHNEALGEMLAGIAVWLSLVQLHSSFHCLVVALVTFLHAQEASGQTIGGGGATQQEQLSTFSFPTLIVLHAVHC